MAEYKISGSFSSNDDLCTYLQNKNINHSTQKIILINEMEEEISDETADGTGESGDPSRMVGGANYYMTIDLSRNELESLLEEAGDEIGDNLFLY